MNELLKEFWKLEPFEVEVILCIFKDKLGIKRDEKNSIDVWMTSRDILIELGGENNWIPLISIVKGVTT